MYKPSILSSSSLLDLSIVDPDERSKLATQKLVTNLLEQASSEDVELIIVHYSVAFNSEILFGNLTKSFPGAKLIGCSSAGEFNKNGYQTQSVVLIAMLKSDFISSVRLIDDLDTLDFDKAYDITADLRQELIINSPFDVEQQMAISFLDGLTMNEEQFLYTFSPVFGNTPHFGGSAGDDLMLKDTFVVHNGDVYSNAAVIALIATRRSFTVFSNDHIQVPVSRLIVTEADPNTRTVFELNGEPAAQYYAKLFSKKLHELTPEVFSKFPLAVLMGDKYYIRSIQKVDIESNSITFYCAVDLGMILTAVQLGDCAQSLDATLNDLRDKYGEPELVYGCDCFLRRLDIFQNQREEELKATQKEFNVVGFNAYGEHMNSIHMNQTFTGVYFTKNEHGSQ